MKPADDSPIQHTLALGQSFWLDYIRRDLVQNGELERLIERGEIRGVTSNPSIFQQAIGERDLYEAAMRPLAHAGWSAERVFEQLAVDDIRAASDLFLPLYEGTGGKDGFVSIEVDPRLADDTQASLEEARRLWSAVNRPNLMVKIPATPAGVPAIEQAISEGININVTLIFDLERYAEVMRAYLQGLERRESDGLALDRIASVASFFVSRVDTAVDRRLEQIVREEGPNAPRAAALLGHAAVANAKLAYAQFKAVFEEPRFTRLQQKGARVQRPLWASTSTKNPAYSDVLYVEQLIGPETVNTLPPKTLEAYRDHGRAEPRLERNLADARAQLEAIEGLGIELRQVTLELEREGVQAFADSFAALIEIVEHRSAEMRAELGELQPRLGPMLERLERERAAARFWRSDPALWPKSGEDLVLDYSEAWQALRPRVVDLMQPARRPEIRRIVWLATGGLRWPQDGQVEQLQAETLDPVEQRKLAAGTPIDSTLFLAVSPHPEDPTIEAMLEPYWVRARNRLGEQAAQHFLIVAPADSQLSRLAALRGVPAKTETEDRLLVYLRSTGAAERELGTPTAAGAPLVILEAEAGAGFEAVRWEMGLGGAAHLLGLEPHPASVDRRALGRLSGGLRRRRGKRRLQGAKPTLETQTGSVWWSASDPPSGPDPGLTAFAGALARRLEPGSVVNLAIHRRRSRALERTVQQLRAQLRQRAIELRVNFGRSPATSGSSVDDRWQLGLILCEQPKLDQPIPGHDRSFAELQLGFAQAVFAELVADGLQAGLMALKPPATINNWLRELIGELG